jgi:hypothetical protein
VLVFKKGTSILLISPAQLVFIYQGDLSDLDASFVANTLQIANDVLGLSSESKVAIKMEITDITNQNTMEASKNFYPEIVNDLDASGMGLRFMINTASFHGDIHVEPYIKDNHRYFLNVVLESKTDVGNDNLHTYISDIMSFGVNKGSDAAKRAFSL